ncbi:hypothetical protein OSB04_006946 [Centaurea solstitialis]|uniref:Uncharacterized protein n=1 Tax=Centaurea solstitialis TaxID=347529 RepID=A0AA38WT04_9ASTR|nr:hypothetical protein OSB04_006946 [Centaurea solstitialis]
MEKITLGEYFDYLMVQLPNEIPAIDWKDSKFEKNELHEHINASQWIDFSANSHSPPDDDCFADLIACDCNRPKTADDFFTKQVPNPSMLQRSSNVSAVDYQNQSSISNTPGKKRKTPMNKRFVQSFLEYLQDIVVLELQANGQLVTTSDDPPIVLGCLNALFIQEGSFGSRNWMEFKGIGMTNSIDQIPWCCLVRGMKAKESFQFLQIP